MDRDLEVKSEEAERGLGCGSSPPACSGFGSAVAGAEDRVGTAASERPRLPYRLSECLILVDERAGLFLLPSVPALIVLLVICPGPERPLSKSVPQSLGQGPGILPKTAPWTPRPPAFRQSCHGSCIAQPDFSAHLTCSRDLALPWAEKGQGELGSTSPSGHLYVLMYLPLALVVLSQSVTSPAR